MSTCANNHPAIQHDEFHCPLCCEMEDHQDTQAQCERLEDTHAGYEQLLDDVDAADVLQLIQQVDDANARAFTAEKTLYRLRASLWA